LGELGLENALDGGEFLGWIGQGVHEAGHARVLDAFQVVAHAHVKDRAQGGVFPAEQTPQDVDQRPGGHVLTGRLLQLEFLRPLDVVAFVGQVNAGPGDLQLVHDLDGL